MPLPLIHALGLVKRCAAEAHLALGTLDPERGDLIVQAAAEVASGQLDDHFPACRSGRRAAAPRRT